MDFSVFRFPSGDTDNSIPPCFKHHHLQRHDHLPSQPQAEEAAAAPQVMNAGRWPPAAATPHTMMPIPATNHDTMVATFEEGEPKLQLAEHLDAFIRLMAQTISTTPSTKSSARHGGETRLPCKCRTRSSAMATIRSQTVGPAGPKPASGPRFPAHSAKMSWWAGL